MCSRYFVTDPVTGERRDIRPGDAAEVLIAGDGGRIERQIQHWGFREIPQAGIVYNARQETALEKRLFGDSLRYRRAAIPADGFYEWNRCREKAVFGDISQGELYLAGFYDLREGEPRFVILTTDANECMRSVHDRMPLLLKKEEVRDWLFDGEKTERYLRRVPFELKKEMDFEQQSFDFL